MPSRPFGDGRMLTETNDPRSRERQRGHVIGCGKHPRGMTGQSLTIPEPAPGQRRAWRIREAAQAYRVSEFTLRTLMKAGRLPFTKVGKILLISYDGAEALFNPK